MKRFTEMYLELDASNRTSEKLAALVNYFRNAPPIDAAWAVYVMSGRKIGKTVSSRQLREWISEVSGYPGWMIDECYWAVGDLSETISLLAPGDASGDAAPALHEIIEQRLMMLRNLPRDLQREMIVRTWGELNADQRFVFHKLLSGNFRVGVSKQMMVRALAEVADVTPAAISHRLAGYWQASEAAMVALLAPNDGDVAARGGLPYPFMLANALNDPLASLGKIEDWQIEWKWDGIRAQIVRRSGKVSLWSRGDELISGAFPEIVHDAAVLPEGTVLDGEIVAWDSMRERPAVFTQLQRRLNRQNVEPSFWPDVAVMCLAFDLLEEAGVDLRAQTLAARRERLERMFNAQGVLRMPPGLAARDWSQIQEEVNNARSRAVEGVILKRLDSAYEAGRPAGLWWKLKVRPFTVDAVMIAAEHGHGRRAGLLTDYTFGVWDHGALVPIAKAYSGLTDAEIAEVDRWARNHSLERHGPVYIVEPTRVFEIGFEAIQKSSRHKSGIALRFPRILRIRSDKKAADADRLETVKALLDHYGVAR